MKAAWVPALLAAMALAGCTGGTGQEGLEVSATVAGSGASYLQEVRRRFQMSRTKKKRFKRLVNPWVTRDAGGVTE